jgi:organic hydroperoxide reductase OsmC/OhrA
MKVLYTAKATSTGGRTGHGVRRAHVICPYSEVSRKGFEGSLDMV